MILAMVDCHQKKRKKHRRYHADSDRRTLGEDRLNRGLTSGS